MKETNREHYEKQLKEIQEEINRIKEFSQGSLGGSRGYASLLRLQSSYEKRLRQEKRRMPEEEHKTMETRTEGNSTDPNIILNPRNPLFEDIFMRKNSKRVLVRKISPLTPDSEVLWRWINWWENYTPQYKERLKPIIETEKRQRILIREGLRALLRPAWIGDPKIFHYGKITCSAKEIENENFFTRPSKLIDPEIYSREYMAQEDKRNFENHIYEINSHYEESRKYYILNILGVNFHPGDTSRPIMKLDNQL